MIKLSTTLKSFVAELSEAAAAARTATRWQVLRETAMLLAVLTVQVAMLTRPLSLPVDPIAVTVGTLCTAATVLARRRWPVAALLGSVLTHVFHSYLAAMVAWPIIAFSAARRASPLHRVWWAILFNAAVACVLDAVLQGAGSIGYRIMSYAGVTVLFMVIPASAGALLRQRRPLVRILRERNEYLERAQELTAVKARLEERTHIASEMHDMLGHRLSLISMHAGGLELTAAKRAPELSEQANLIRTTASTAMTELREILGVLRAFAGDDADSSDESSDSRALITRLVNESQQAGIDVRLTWSGPDLANMGLPTRKAAHRLVREGLTNIHKHASGANAAVEINVGDDMLRVCVSNGPVAGHRQSLPGTRRGLVGLEERVILLGGNFSAGSTADGGFQISATMPTRTADIAPAIAVPQHPEGSEPLVAEAITLPRALGAGCLGSLVAVPVAIMLLAMAMVLFLG